MFLRDLLNKQLLHFLAASETISSYFPKCSNSHKIGKVEES